MAVHPKCGKTFPTGERAGHCGACRETFIGNTSFEAHRVGSFPLRDCKIQPYDTRRTETGTIKYGQWQDARGYWRYGKQLTAEESAAVIAARHGATK